MGYEKAMIAKCHIGRGQIAEFADEETWRMMLEEVAGGRKLSAMTQAQLARVIDHLAKRGAAFTTKAANKGKTYRAKAGRRSDFYEIPDGPLAPVKRKICAMWRELGYDMISLDTRTKRQNGADAFRFCCDGKFLDTLARDLSVRLKRKEEKAEAAKATA